ncbi:MAG: SHOCT domain-containing protein [Bacteroidales bacterium]|nr:SHOCT domain-containing protein [Bacteroidales bacterium]MDD2611239.1 SHOCT domain-containing protein [Bacteroidales bacterium]MDD3907395.1 SHOCT domain-containing protein [Bacteroidales bacterium]MDD4711969.1 SHOCT domain-containing protein [Bacteroidales bacterium]
MRKSKFHKEKVVIVTALVSLSFIFSGCATLIGGSNYYAHVIVENRPGATIYYQGENMGRGQAIVSVPRSHADKLSFVIKEDGGQEEEFLFTQRKFRTWAFVGTVICWTGITNTGIPLPWGVALDCATGALWQPDIKENGVTKLNYKNFKYLLTYTGFIPDEVSKDEVPATPVQNVDFASLEKLKELLDKGILTQEEFDKQKAKILEK